MFERTSRYHGIATAAYTLPDGRTVPYVRRRFLPRPEELMTIGEHIVAPGDRLDRIAARRYGDPEQSWQLADANRAMRPEDLTAAVGRRLRLTLPVGVPATTEPGGAR
ncbi:LysM peptidoglycan-binding domain-containing protein [Streptomyces sp. ISL-10]|uniref:LysM peptidoglycan-binding domain-containing protein n=1 Tax=Streptomyces sp. ISL-10 TaxID=2819172 RepID=UPI001BE58334|nr:LysM domain-containing protein [Streptomyces sp. ISL-10]MBT2369857.1 LysM peptidoglycan-binding domain-containing protein [Streptomyces sp. ISL-10]